jgi:hypothetical protein
MPNNIRPEGDDQPWKRATDEELASLRQRVYALEKLVQNLQKGN